MNNQELSKKAEKKRNHVEYGKYGYLFIAPFFIVYLLFQLGPLLYTFWLSVQEYYTDGWAEVGPKFIGLDNFTQFFTGEGGWTNAPVFKTLGNTMLMWIANFIPQIALSLLFAKWFTDTRVKLKAQGAYKVVMFLPNIITAASISLLFSSLFAAAGPICTLAKNHGMVGDNFDFLQSVSWSRAIIAFIQFWMWYGNTMILLIAGMLGINPSLYEAAMVDGATSGQIFKSITLPLLKPIILFTFVTSAIGGLQMYDIPLLFNKGQPEDATKTITMYIKDLTTTNYGKAASSSIILFIVTLIISLVFFKVLGDNDETKTKKKKTKALKKAN